jgi:hypothetical protein
VRLELFCPGSPQAVENFGSVGERHGNHAVGVEVWYEPTL